MDEINKTCKTAIDNENILLLSYVPGLQILISTENPLYVDQIFPKYRYMSLLQYSVAAKKPKSLEFLLKYALETCKLPLQRIILPVQTPSRDMNLIALAIEFHSNSCLKTLKQFIFGNLKKDEKFDFDIEDQFGETPLTKALRDRNDEASLILINECNADLMHKANEENSILRPLLPIIVFFLNYNNSKEINHLWQQIKIEKRQEILKSLEELNFDNNFRIDKNGKTLKDVLLIKDLIEIRSFLISQTGKSLGPIHIINQIEEEEEKPEPIRHRKEEASHKCCNCTDDAEYGCEKCGKYFCARCKIEHKC